MVTPDANQEAAADQLAFFALVQSLPPQRPHPTISKFVKKLDGLQEFVLLPALPRMAAISLVDRGLIGQFTGLWLGKIRNAIQKAKTYASVAP